MEDRRNQGWGKVATILGILEEVTLGQHRVEVGLMLRQAILINSLLFSAEAWSGVTDKLLSRLEVVDNALLCRLTGGHSKCPTEFNYLETGTMKLRHILTFRRLMYHHHILTRSDDETIKKIYYKQKENYVRGDWYELLLNDFKFINKSINEDEICAMTKTEYKIVVKKLVEKAAFTYFMQLKSKHSKINEVIYKELKIQPYLTSKLFNNNETSLRSRCHESKLNFKNMYKQDLLCTFGCKVIEDQQHIFTSCDKIGSRLGIKTKPTIKYEHIFGSMKEQKEAIQLFLRIEHVRIVMKDQLLPGGTLPGPMHLQQT